MKRRFSYLRPPAFGRTGRPCLRPPAFGRTGRPYFSTSAIALASLLLIAGCEDEKKTRVSSDEDGGPSDKPAVDPNIAKAMAAASARGAAAAGRQPGGPPPTGVFEPGEADKAMPKGSAPKITLGSEGSDPKMVLGAMQPAGGFKRDLSVQLMLRSGPRQGLPPVDFVLGLQTQTQKPKAADPAQAPAAKPEEPLPAGAVEVLAIVKGVRVSPSQSGVPKDLDAELGKLKGSRISFRVGPNGAGDAFRYELGKASGLELIMRALTESLATFTLPYPDKPVGAGAFWMATTRETAIGTDVIAYRIVKVEELSKEKLKLSVNTKRYATSSKFDIPELPKGADYKLDQFDSQGEGEFEVAPGTPFPIGGEAKLVLNANLVPSNQPDQRVGVQSQTQAAFALAPK